MRFFFHIETEDFAASPHFMIEQGNALSGGAR